MDRLAIAKPRLKMNPYTVRRLVITAIVVACKDTGNFQDGDLAYYGSVEQIYNQDSLTDLESDMRHTLNGDNEDILSNFESYEHRMIIRKPSFFPILGSSETQFLTINYSGSFRN